MPQLLILAFLLWLVYQLGACAFAMARPALLLALAAWLAFALVYGAYLVGVALHVRRRLASLVTVNTRAQSLRFLPRTGVADQDASRWTLAAVLVSVSCGALAYLYMVDNHLFEQAARGASLCRAIGGFVGLGEAIVFLAVGIFLVLLLNGQRPFGGYYLALQADRLNHHVASVPTFARAEARNHRLRSALYKTAGLASEADAWRARLHQELTTRVLQSVHDRGHLQTTLRQQAQALQAENAVLARLLDQRRELADTYVQACRAANHSGSAMMFDYLDGISNAMAELDQRLLATSAWDEYADLMAQVQAELQQLLDTNSKRASAGADQDNGTTAPPPAGPYAVLGVRRSLSNAQLKDVYRRLAAIYHSDKGYAPDDAKLQEINRAWGQICAERGM